MDEIIEYLRDPMKNGVYNSKIIVDLIEFKNYLEEMVEGYQERLDKETSSRKRTPSIIRERNEENIARLQESIEELDEAAWYNENIFKRIVETLRLHATYKSAPSEVVKFFYNTVPITSKSKTRLRIRRLRRPIPKIFESRILPKAVDVIDVEKKHTNDKRWFFDIASIKEKGISTFKEDIERILPKGAATGLSKGKYHSQRYVYKPYSLATSLFLEDEKSVVVHPDLKSFMRGAVRYIHSSEWRTSIVLSSIAVENVLADLYEDKYKKPAPDTPLGNLFKQVKKKVNLTQDVVDAVETTNKARIAAVHRSRLTVSHTEAVSALFGAVNLILWYCSSH